MSIEQVKKLLKQKESVRLEFKEAENALPSNLFESICSMLNHDGGDILLGVNNHGEVVGVNPAAVDRLKSDIVNLSNNPQKLDPPNILFPLVYTAGGKKVFHIQIPASSQVHKSDHDVFDRSNDGDYRVKQPQQIAEIYNRKRLHYTEGIIYPYVKFSDFKADLFPKVRNLIKSNEANHPWLSLADQEMLEKAGLWKKDYQSGKEGYTLAAVLLFGKDEVIQHIVPHYKTDAILRIKNKDRYDDREYVRTNLIESYEKLMAFVAKHLPDKFYKEGNQRKSLRAAIFHEIVSNIIVHREYTNAYPATMIIHPDRVETENANNPNGHGPIILGTFTPFPKNPTIAKFFIQLGLVEELGSGFINVNRLIKEYGGKGSPQFIEGNTFKMVIPISQALMMKHAGIVVPILADGDEIEGANEGVIEGAIEGITDGVTDGVIDGVSDGVKSGLISIVAIINNNPGIRIEGIVPFVKKAKPTIERYLKILRKINLIEYQGAPKTGGYYLTETMKMKLKL